ncbi:MAG: preprotein translocase subunit SecY [Thermoprotei archaeon]|nr:MAG: preprotein translocase subunit SecY [Thermoprotei archaeon]
MPSFLETLEPILRYLPSVPKPPRRLSLGERLFWTFIVLTIYLVMSETPLYGVAGRAREQLTLISIIFASRSGTLTTLGVGPIVTAGLILQILVGSKIIHVDFTDPRQRSLFTAAEKFFAIIFTIFEAVAYIFGGMFGPVTLKQALLILAQLTAAGIIIILLDEMIHKGWGLGSGLSLFIAASVATRLFWDLFSPFIVADRLPFGVIPALGVALYSAAMGNATSLVNLVWRVRYPDIVGLVATVALILAILYLNLVRVDIPITVARYGTARTSLPLRLLYTSVIPVIFTSALLANLQLLTQILWSRYNPDNTNPILNWIAKYELVGGTRPRPLPGCLAYYITSPRSQLTYDPVQIVIYAIVYIGLCVLFSKLWVELAGMDPESQAEYMVKSGLTIPGFRHSQRIIAYYLSKYIPALTVASGILVGAIAVVGDVLRAFATGTGILLLIGILEQYYAILVRERAMEMYPFLRRLLERR